MPEPGAVLALGDSGLEVAAERDDVGGPDTLLAGFGGTMRDGLGVRAGRGGVELALVGGLVLDPLLGVVRTSLGITGGRVTHVGRAGNPDTMDGIDVVLDTATNVVDAHGMVVTPGAVDAHVHLLSPQVADAALAGGVTTLVIQDPGPVWNLGVNPARTIVTTWAALEAVPLNAVLLARASASRPETVQDALRAGAGGLKIHEDVSAGPEQIRCALDVADAFDVQLMIHTDGLNESVSVEETFDAFGGRTVHAYHIEGVGGGHAPDLLRLAGRERVLTSSTNPTVPFGVGAEAEHLAMVAAVHLLSPGRQPGDWEALRRRVRPETMAAEQALHDLGVIPMLTSDSQGMGRVGELVMRALQAADVAKQMAAAGAPGAAAGTGAPGGPADNDRVLRYLAKATVNPAIATGIAAHVGSLAVGRLADAVVWRPENVGVRPELVLKAGYPAWGVAGGGNATVMLAEPTRVGPQIGALGGAAARLSLAFVSAAAMDADLPIARERAAVGGCRDLTAADMVRHGVTGEVRVDPATLAVTLDGEPIGWPAAARVPLGPRHLIG